MSISPEHSAAGSLLCGEDADEVVSSNLSIFHRPSPPSLPLYSPPSDETTVGVLVETETHHMPNSDYLSRCRDRSVDVTARLDSINWILKVHAYYHFRPVTAFLSVNYLDRFLSCSSLPRPNGWPFQLLSVACLSLAAKMEEPHVPLLLDLQLFEPRFVFEPKTVQRMELWVMANLRWRLRSVTPFDYLDFFISKLPSSSNSQPQSLNRLFSAASDLIVSTTRVVDFLGFAPSTIAAAAVLCSAGQAQGAVPENGQLQLFFHERVNNEMVRSCHQLLEEYVVDTCSAASHKGREAEDAAAPPSSPVGVLDAATCGSCDTRSENPGSLSGQADIEPANKRLRSSAPDVQQR
ncbi:hypothetical protein L6164_035789 [Bauhinia variegata]|uniref:Uncharacterized protein n=1 Tax=Bauhinia variegata TaxID=167791 RepID=A0ACB9KF11_BAUVA|nr:hypothetical protein L6164_035789 [Bauhinia variegata]